MSKNLFLMGLKLGIFSLWLFKRHLYLYIQYDNFWFEYKFALYFGKDYVFETYGEASFNIKQFFSVMAKLKRTRIKFTIVLLGLIINVRLGHIHYLEEYDEHTDKYYYGEYNKETNKFEVYKDEKLTEPYIFSEPRKEVYKEFYSTKWMRIYNKNWLNCLYGRTLEFALPYLYYLKIGFKRPFDEWNWLGFTFDINFENKFLTILSFMLFKHELKIIISKNSLHRKSNIFSNHAIDRYVQLKRNYTNKLDNYNKELGSPFDILINYNKSAQLKHIIPFLDFKDYLTKRCFDRYSSKYNFNRCIFDTCYEHLIKYDIAVENWQYLNNDTDITQYAYDKLLKLRNERINKQQKTYAFSLKNLERVAFCNGYYIIDYIDTDIKGKTYLKTLIMDKNNACFDVPENILVSYITKNKQIIGHFQDDNTIKGGSVLFNMADYSKISPDNMDNIEIIDYGTEGSSEKYFKGLKNKKYGLINENGTILVPPHYLDLSEAGNGLIIAQKSKNKYGLIDIHDNIIIPFDYEDISTIGIKYFTAKKNGKWGLYNYQNQNIISLQYQDFYFYEDFGIAKYQEKWGIVNIKNKSCTGFIFDDIDINVDNVRWFPVGTDNAVLKRMADKSKLLDVNVCINKKWGTYSLINGKRIIPLEYDKIDYFYNGICCVETHNGEGVCYIDRHNNIIAGWGKDANTYNTGHYPVEEMYKIEEEDGSIEFRFHDKLNAYNESFEQAHHYSDGLVAISLHGHWGFMDKDQNIVIPLIFDDVHDFHDGKAFVQIGNRWGIIDKTGKEIKINKNINNGERQPFQSPTFL